MFKYVTIFFFFWLTYCIQIPLCFAERDNQLWSLISAAGTFDEEKEYRWYLEVQPRLGDGASRMERLFTLGMVGKAIPAVSDRLVLWLGYAHAPLFMDSNYDGVYRPENRLLQQATYWHVLFTDTHVAHRLRLEQRFNDGQPETSHRTRYQLRVSQPLLHSDKNIIGVGGYNEIFANFNSGTPGQEAGYDRNRFFLGPYYKTDLFRADIGYLTEYGVRRTGGDRILHVMLFQIAFAL